MINKNVVLMAIQYFFANIFYVFPFVFLQPFLSSLGYSVIERGVLLSSCAVVAIFSQFFVGYLCDKYRTNKKFYIATVVLVILAAVLLYSQIEKNFVYHLLLVAAIGGLLRTLMAIQDAWCFEIDNDTKRFYGPIRAFGSAGWMIASPIVSIFISRYGYISLVYSTVITGIILMIISTIVKDATKYLSIDPVTTNDVKVLLKNKSFTLIIIIFFIINVLDTANIYTVIDKMMFLNTSDQLISWRWSIQALVELPLFLMGTYLLKRFGDFKLLIFSSIMFSLKFFLFALAKTPEQIILVAMLQAITFPLFLISSKTLVDSVTPANLKSSGQTIASSLSNGPALLLTPIISGILINSFGVNITLAIFGVFGLLALIFGYKLKNLNKIS
jgi:MFS family permease